MILHVNNPTSFCGVFQSYETLLPENPTLGEVSAIQPHQSQLKEKLQACNFGASHIKGKENFIADALSRAPHRDPIPDEEEEGEDVMCIRAVKTRSMTSLSGSGSPEIGDPNLDWVRKEVSNDPACQQSDEFLRGILELRNTPKSHGKSPAELIYNRPLRSHVPSMMPNHVTEHIQQRCQASKENYDRTARELPPLRASSVLQRVLQLNWKRRKKTSRKSVNYVAVQESDECVLIYSQSSFNLMCS